MPNYCYYIMKIKGKKEDCEAWIRKIRSYDEENHFFRMFDPVVMIDEYGTDDDYTMEFDGDCAWSLESCCRSGYTDIDLFAKNTEDLHLKMEAFSQEPGFAFQEHYLYDNGQCVESECVDWTEVYYDKSEYKSFADFKADFDDILYDVTEEDFDEDGYYHIGGFENFGEFSI